jgi:hypothetical protein
MSVPFDSADILSRLMTNRPGSGEVAATSAASWLMGDPPGSTRPDGPNAGFDNPSRKDPESVDLIQSIRDAFRSELTPDREGFGSPQCATLASVARLLADVAWPWPGWLAGAALNSLASDPGVGKTLLAMTLARTLWFGTPWPDGQANPFPKGTRTLWVPGDHHYPQLLDLATRYELPYEAILLNAHTDSPIGGLDLDDQDELDDLFNRIRIEAPGLVIIDTVGMTTGRNLGKPEEAREYFGPLMTIASRTKTAFLLLTHLSKDSQALGRRIVGASRVMWKMTHPDPDGQPDRRKLWVDKSYAARPSALGMTIAGAGCTFDFDPPVDPPKDLGGRPSVKLDKAMAFIESELADGDRKGAEIIERWLGIGENKPSIFDAKLRMQNQGRLVVDDSKRPQVWRLVALER